MNEHVDSCYAEQLHCADNAYQQLFKCLLNEAVARSTAFLNVKTIHELSEEVPMKKFLVTLKETCRARRLDKKVVQWWNDGRKKSLSIDLQTKRLKLFATILCT